MTDIDISNYPNFVHKLFANPEPILESLTLEKINLWHAASGVAGEAGEVLDEVKKIVAYGREIDDAAKSKLVKELGDLEFYMEAVRQTIGVHRAEVISANMEKLYARYEGGVFSNEAANSRKDVK